MAGIPIGAARSELWNELDRLFDFGKVFVKGAEPRWRCRRLASCAKKLESGDASIEIRARGFHRHRRANEN